MQLSSILFWFPVQHPTCGDPPNWADMDSWSQRWWQLSFGCLILCPCQVSSRWSKNYLHVKSPPDNCSTVPNPSLHQLIFCRRCLSGMFSMYV